MGVGE
jgi:hypothetical protein